jgi:lipoprotein-anchoring transpeptidase ErfK/SrfK
MGGCFLISVAATLLVESTLSITVKSARGEPHSWFKARQATVPSDSYADFSTIAGQQVATTSLHQRLVIALSDREVALYEYQNLIVRYPVGIGRQGWETPIGTYQIHHIQKSPIWKHPITGEIIQPGPDNPLGAAWIGFWSNGNQEIGFHGTPDETAVGQAISHGCIRMRNADVLALADRVAVGVTVQVQP